MLHSNEPPVEIFGVSAVFAATADCISLLMLRFAGCEKCVQTRPQEIRLTRSRCQNPLMIIQDDTSSESGVDLLRAE
jgi:hypothetical protein